MINQPKNKNKPGSESSTDGISRKASRTSTAWKKILLLISGVFLLLLAPFLIHQVIATNPPPTPGFGSGIIQYDQPNNRLSFSTSTVIVGTSTPPANPPTTPSTDPKLFVNGQFVANSIVTNDITAYSVSSTIVNGGYGGTIAAERVVPGTFNYGNPGSYSFPGYLGIATTTNVSIPQALSVYGGGYLSGNVGIGVTLPQYPLHVVTPADGSTIGFYVDNQTSLGSVSIGIVSKATDNGSNYDYDFYGLGPETLFTGNVGIGTTIGQSLGSNMLTVSGTSMFGNLLEAKTATTTQIRWRRSTGSTFADLISPTGGGRVGISAKNVAAGGFGGLSFYVSTSTADALAMTIIDSGNVGINTSNPQYKLDVNGTFGAATSTFTGQIQTAISGIKFYDGTVQTTSPLGSGSGSTGRVVFWQSTTTLGFNGNFFWDNANKYLGIGTTAPDRPLTIYGANNELMSLAKSDGTAKWHINIKAYASPYNGLNFAETGVSDYVLLLKSGGNVGIGTGNPASKLGISGNVTIGSSSGYSNPSSPRAAPANGLIVEGMVGIGTYTPAYSLHVGGNSMVTGSSSVAGTAFLNGDVNLGDTGGWGGDNIYFKGNVASSINFAGPISQIGDAPTYQILGGPGGTSGDGGGITIMAGGGDIYANGGSLYLKGGTGGTGGTSMPGSVYIDTTYSGYDVGGGNIIFRTEPGGTTSLSEKMRVSRSGNIGIGTTAPAALLEIANSSANTLRLRKTAGALGSVNLFVSVGGWTGGLTGNGVCQQVTANSVCLAAWGVNGANYSCSQTFYADTMRILCAGFGD